MVDRNENYKSYIKYNNTCFQILNFGEYEKLGPNAGEIDIPSEKSSRKIILTFQDTLFIAEFMKREFGYTILLFNKETVLTDIADAEVIWFVGLSSKIKDDILLGLLKNMRDNFLNKEFFYKTPIFSILTNRDFDTLTFLLAKIVLNKQKNKSENKISLAKFVPHHTSTEVIYHTYENSTSRFDSKMIDNFSDFFAHQTSFDLISSSTHGFEACANGGNGNVLCGLSQNVKIDSLNAESNKLSCGYNFPCPRGPQPFPLKFFPTKVLMLGSCNGLRLADSCLNENFNLGLTFLEGDGICYISNLFSSTANKIIIELFHSAIFSGYSVGKALRMVNLFLLSSNLDHPSMLMIGNPEHYVVPFEKKKSCSKLSSKQTVLNANFSSDYFYNCKLISRETIKLVCRARIIVLVFNVVPEDMFWFANVEKSPLDIYAPIVTIHIFRYPMEIENLAFEIVGYEKTQRQLKKLLMKIIFWTKQFDYIKLPETDNDLANALVNVKEILEEFSLNIDKFSNYMCYSGVELKNLFEIANELIVGSIEHYIKHASEKLKGPFWLYNTYSADFKLNNITYGKCIYCKGNVILKKSSAISFDETRKISFCPRCGIIEDVLLDNSFSSVKVNMDDDVFINTEMGFSITFIANKNIREEVIFVPKISSAEHLAPFPNCQKLNSFKKGQVYNLDFRVKLDESTIPHRYFLKFLIVCPDKILFYSCPFFIKPKFQTLADLVTVKNLLL